MEIEQPPFARGEIIWIDDDRYPRTGGLPGGWAMRVERYPVPADGWPGYWWVGGPELSASGAPLVFRSVCIRPSNVRPERPGRHQERKLPLKAALRAGSRWRPLEDLDGTATKRPHDYPGRLRFPEAEQ